MTTKTLAPELVQRMHACWRAANLSDPATHRIGNVEVSIHPQAPIPDEAMDARLKTFEDFCVVTQSVREGIDVKVNVSRPSNAE